MTGAVRREDNSEGGESKVGREGEVGGDKTTVKVGERTPCVL
jgi:hypothetical protein